MAAPDLVLLSHPPTLKDAFTAAVQRIQSDSHYLAHTSGTLFGFAPDAEVALMLSSDVFLADPEAMQAVLIRLIARHSPALHTVLAVPSIQNGTKALVLLGCSQSSPSLQIGMIMQEAGVLDPQSVIPLTESLLPEPIRSSLQQIFADLPIPQIPAALSRAHAFLGMDLGALFEVTQGARSLATLSQATPKPETYN